MQETQDKPGGTGGFAGAQRIDALLTLEDVEWLDAQAAEIRRKSGSKPSRSALLRFILGSMREGGDNPAEWI